MVGEVVDVRDVVSMVVKDENVLKRLLRLLENVMEPSKKGHHQKRSLVVEEQSYMNF